MSLKKQAGTRLSDVKESNLAKVIKIVSNNPNCSRTFISNKLGLTPAAISKLIFLLKKNNLIVDAGNVRGTDGRPSISLRLNKDDFATIGVRLLRDSIVISVCNIVGDMLWMRKIEIHPNNGVDIAIFAMLDLIKEAIVKVLPISILAVGVAVPGPFIADMNKIVLMSSFAGWEKVNIQKILEDEIKLPIFIQHDTACGAIGEYWYNKEGSSITSLVYIAANHKGIGMGSVVNGKLTRGILGFSKEIGHTTINCNGERCVCGNYGCLDLYCSDTVFFEEIRSQCDSDNEFISRYPNIDSALQKVVNGDEIAIHAYKKVIKYLGVGIVNIVNSIGPEYIIVGDKMAKPKKLMYNVLDKMLHERLCSEIYEKLNLIILNEDYDPILKGANALAFSMVTQSPLKFLIKKFS